MDFAQVTELASAWRPLTSAEQARATSLLGVASRWIRRRKPDIADGDPDAKLVVIEVVKAAMLNAAYQGHSSYSKTVGPYTRSGTLTPESTTGALTFLPWMRELLGIPVGEMPVGEFGDAP